MDRRRFLAASLATGLAGCTVRTAPDATGETERRTPTGSRDTVDLPVARSELERRLPRDHIPAIVEPAFAVDWRDVPDVPDGLPDDAPVVGVEREGVARAYPLRVLDWHEVVNDSLADPLLVTYCVLCGSAVVAERTVDGTPATFGVSGQLWRSNLVMYDDRTDSRWSQLLAAAIRGPATGTSLSLLPASLTSWREWRTRHPETDVLLPPPHSNTRRGRDATFDYGRPKYDYGDEDQLVGYDGRDGALHSKTMVLGIEADGVARAYPFHEVTAAGGVVEDTVGPLPVVVATTPGGSMVGYDRRVDGRALSVAPAGERHLAAGGSRWTRADGRAVDGPHEGRALAAAADHPPTFWRGWSNVHPGTTVYTHG